MSGKYKWVQFGKEKNAPYIPLHKDIGGVPSRCPLSVMYFPDKNILMIKEEGKHFDDHACIKFEVKSFEESEDIILKIIQLVTF